MRAVVISHHSGFFPEADTRLDWNYTEYGLY